MKTKRQILKWLDAQPWAIEFYKEAFLDRALDLNLSYGESFISSAFFWDKTKQGEDVWGTRDTEFRQWYNSNDKPTSWEEYCKQNPIKDDEYFIAANCAILDLKHEPRDVNSEVNVMSKDLCEAFLAYMKLIQLRNAWVKGIDDNCNCKILVIDGELRAYLPPFVSEGLSFPTVSMANEFMDTFMNLLEVAKPLL